MLQTLLVITACVAVIDFFKEICDHDLAGACFAIAFIVLCGYSAYVLGTFAFVMGIIISVMYGVAMIGFFLTGKGLGFLYHCTMLVLYIVGVVKL